MPDFLKKLWKDKTVIIVSHDREFAERYGDRIAELKDGRAINDTLSCGNIVKNVTKNVSFDGNTLSLKDGSSLTNEEISKIKEYLTTDIASSVSPDPEETLPETEPRGTSELCANSVGRDKESTIKKGRRDVSLSFTVVLTFFCPC